VLVGTIGITGTVTAEVFDGVSSQGSAGATVNQPVQQTYIVIPLGFSGDSIEITFDVGAGNQFNIGYLYVGSWESLPKIGPEAITYRVESTDPRNITRAGTSISGVGYEYANISLTLNEEDLGTARARVKTWALEGFSVPRIFYFDEPCLLTGDAVYAIFDSEALQLDPSYRPGQDAAAALTIGLTEVF
jgi:hypothetical protein